ncbi:MAG: hypothetical protein ACN4ES_14915 [Cellulophaga baltica]
MKKTAKRKALILIPIAMFIVAASNIGSQFLVLTDITKGLSIGIGIGLLLTALTFGNFKSA